MLDSQEVRQLVALITWLQSFSKFKHVLFDELSCLDRNEEELAQLTFQHLENPNVSRSTLDVAHDVCAPASMIVPSNATNKDIWKGIHLLSGSKGFVRALGRSEIIPLCALSNLLKAAVTNTDLAERKCCIERIMLLPKDVQQILMTVVERQKGAPRSRSKLRAGVSTRERLLSVRKIAKVETRALQQEEDLSVSHKNEVAKLRLELQQTKEECEKSKKAQRELNSARDEIEPMQHNQEKLADATERLRIYKEPIDKEGLDLNESLIQLEIDKQKSTEKHILKKGELENLRKRLKESQECLDALKHTEKDLNRNLSESKETAEKTEKLLAEERVSRQELQEESQRALEATRQVLHAKAKKDVEEIQSNMNHFLEDEREAYRLKVEHSVASTQEIGDKWRKEYMDLQERSAASVKNTRQETQARVDKIEIEYKTENEAIKKQAEKGRNALIERGQTMIEEAKRKAKVELQALHDDAVSLKSQLNEAVTQKNELEVFHGTQLNSMKQKLHFATEQIRDLMGNSDELQLSMKTLKWEKSILEEENDKYQRQLGGRYGTDGKMKIQLEKHQKEYNLILEDNRELKRKMQHFPIDGVSNVQSPNGSSPYSRSGVSSSALIKLCKEYETTIEALNNEKEELVMKNSVAITKVQRASQTTWEREQEVSRLKTQIPSLKLEFQRNEHRMNEAMLLSRSVMENKSLSKTEYGRKEIKSPEEDSSSRLTTPSRILTPSNKYSNKANDFFFTDQNRASTKADPYSLASRDITKVSNSGVEYKAQFPILESTVLSETKVDGYCWI